MAALYEINNELYKLYEASVNEDGEIDEKALASIESLEMERSVKIENIGCLIKNLRSDAEQIKAESEKLAKRAKAAQNRAERLKDYLAMHFMGEKFRSPRVVIGWGKTSSVVIEDESIIPEEYATTETVVKIDKNEIKAAIKAGNAVPGCVLEEKQYIMIR